MRKLKKFLKNLYYILVLAFKHKFKSSKVARRIPVAQETPEEEANRARLRKKRIVNRTHTYTLNRKDRRFLKRVTGETYPAGSQTTLTLVRRVRFLMNMPLKLHIKRQVARSYLTYGKFI